jgi:hypothetical protein
MKLDSRQYREALLRLSHGKATFAQQVDGALVQWLSNQNVPIELIEFNKTNSLASSIPLMEFGEVYTPETVVEINSKDPAILRARFLQIASAPNGDPIVVDLQDRDGRVGYLSHEDLWGYDDRSPRDLFAPVAASIGEFFHRVSIEDDFPVDYFAATGDL